MVLYGIYIQYTTFRNYQLCELGGMLTQAGNFV